MNIDSRVLFVHYPNIPYRYQSGSERTQSGGTKMVQNSIQDGITTAPR